MLFKVKADTLFLLEHFDSYSTGNLIGQGDWVTMGLSSAQVTSAQSYTSSNSVNSSNTFQGAQIPVDTVQIGYLEFNFYDAGGTGAVNIQEEDSYNYVSLGDNCSGDSQMLVGSGSTCIDYTEDSWHLARVEFNTITDEVRGNIDGGSFTAWEAQAFNNDIELVQIFYVINVDTIYIDDVAIYDTSFTGIAPTITDPASGSSVVVGDYLFSGECVNNASNQLALTDGATQPIESNFNINCSGNSWSATSTILFGFNQKNLFDKQWLDGQHSTTSAFIFYTGVTSTTTPELCADSGFWCELLQIAFVPSNDSMELYSDNLLPLFNTKIPFGYFNLIKNKLLITTTSTTTLDLDITLPLGGVTTTVNIFNSNWDPIQNVAYNFRPWLTIAMWLALAIYLLERIMHIDL